MIQNPSSEVRQDMRNGNCILYRDVVHIKKRKNKRNVNLKNLSEKSTYLESCFYREE